MTTSNTLREQHSDYDIIEAANQIIGERYTPGQLITSPVQAHDLLIHHFSDDVAERFVAIFLDNKNHIIKIESLFNGTIDQVSVYPREVVRKALDFNASAVVFAHNHPSTVTSPSQADIRITKKLKETLSIFDIRVLDHIIVGGSTTQSMAELGYV